RARAVRVAPPRPCAAPTSGTGTCRGPRSSSCRRRTRAWGSRPRSPGTRADAPRWRRRSGCPWASPAGPWAAPMRRARRRAPGAGPNAGGGRCAPGPRSAEHPRGPRWRLRARRCGRSGVLPDSAAAALASSRAPESWPSSWIASGCPSAWRPLPLGWSARSGLLRRRFFGCCFPRGFLGGGLGRPGALAVSLGVLRAHGVEACLQRAHQVWRRRADLFGRRLHRDLLAVSLALDQLEHLLAIGVAIFVRLEISGQRSDQLLGDVHLALVRLGGGSVGELLEP